MPRGGPRPGSGRKASAATKAIREIVNDPECIENALRFAATNAEFWFKLYQQIHGRPYQQIGATVEHLERHEVSLPSGDPIPTCGPDLSTFGPN